MRTLWISLAIALSKLFSENFGDWPVQVRRFVTVKHCFLVNSSVQVFVVVSSRTSTLPICSCIATIAIITNSIAAVFVQYNAQNDHHGVVGVIYEGS
jgi:hypothetical protein